jgi:hypothetical protein
MLGSESPEKKLAKPFSVRRAVDRKIFRFAVVMGIIGTFLTICVFLAPSLSKLQHSRQINLDALDKVHCENNECDTSELTADGLHEDPDYLVDSDTRFFLDAPTADQGSPSRFGPLDFGDMNFVRQFRQPTPYDTPDGEVWHLYSRGANWGNTRVEIILGYAVKAPWKILTSSAQEVFNADAELKREADTMTTVLSASAARSKFTQKMLADGFAILDADSGEILIWGPWIPMLMPKDRLPPKPGRQLYTRDKELYIVQADGKDRLTSISLADVGSLPLFATIGALTFVVTMSVARGLCRRYLRNYFAVMNKQLPSLSEGCASGEGQRVEFKRGLSEDATKTGSSEDELLKSIAAFANTNDGVIFVGVDDLGKIRGLEFNFTQRDRFERKIRQLVRNRIKPSPPVDITFEEIRGLVVAKITVARGESTVYLLNGVIYVRSGSSDVQAQPEDLMRLVA